MSVSVCLCLTFLSYLKESNVWLTFNKVVHIHIRAASISAIISEHVQFRFKELFKWLFMFTLYFISILNTFFSAFLKSLSFHSSYYAAKIYFCVCVSVTLSLHASISEVCKSSGVFTYRWEALIFMDVKEQFMTFFIWLTGYNVDIWECFSFIFNYSIFPALPESPRWNLLSQAHLAIQFPIS